MDAILDQLLLSRIQFAVTTMFHILFPVLTIGLAVYLVIIEALWLAKGEEIYYRLYRFWVKIFAINFGVGVVSGIVLEFEFGTNFARFSEAVANVFSPLLAFEALTAFFLEAGFLGIMLFGWKRVPRGVHFLSTCLVAAGSSFSAFWIMAANSWMQTPAGYQLVNGKFMVTDFVAAIFNPALPVRVSHMVVAAYESSAFAVAGISAYFLLRNQNTAFYRRSLGLALIMAAVFAPLQVYVGDANGRMIFHRQPAKLAAIEGLWETQAGAPFVVIAFPDMEKERNDFEIAIPNGTSLLVTHTFDGRVQGLKDFPRGDRPNASVLFWTFRLMVAVGFLYFFMMIWAAFLWWRGGLYQSRPFLLALILTQPLGFLAVELGWLTTEMGRQPWLVYNLMKTAQGLSLIHPGNVVWSLILFFITFPVVGASYFFFVFKTLRSGPDLTSPVPQIQHAGMRPLPGAEEKATVRK